MTSPESVGEVSVELVADAKELAKDLKGKVEKGFKDLDPGKTVRDKVKRSKPIPLPVTPEPDTKGLPEKVKEETKKRPVKIPAVVDPLLDQFRTQVRRQITQLAKTINADIPVGADTDELRRELGAELARLTQQTRAEIPVTVGDRQRYEQDLRAAVTAVANRVNASVEVTADTAGLNAEVAAAAAAAGARNRVRLDVDADRSGGLARMRGLFSDLAGAIQQAVGSAAALGATIAGALGNAAGSILAGVAAFGALAAAASLAVPAIAAVAGAIAAIPGALSGIGAAVATLGLGFKGIADAFKPSSGGGGGGGGAVNQARQIAAAARQVEAARRGIAAANRQVEASERALAAAQRGVAEAERRVVDAQARVLASQKAINVARERAIEDIEDLNRSLRGARLSEEEAALGVEEALRALEAAKLTGNIPDIKRADLAYRQALQTLDEAKDTTADLAKETEEANKKGVEGSDLVQDAYADQKAALDDLRSAQVGLIDANDGLKSAQDGVKSALDGVKSATDGLKSAQDALAQAQTKVASGGGGVAREVTKLAPAAQKFVDAIKALKPAFEDLRLDVQQRLFQGLDKTVTRLGEAWIPALKDTLGRYADTFNGFFKDLGKSVTTPKFISDIQAGAEGARKGLDKIFESVSKSLVPAFGALSRAAGPFLEKFGDEIAAIVEEFSDWVLEGEKTGRLQRFFESAAEAMRDISTTGKNVGKILGKIVGIITGESGKGTNDSVIDSLNRQLDKISKWLDDPKNQQQVKDFIRDVGDLAKNLGEAAKFAAKLVGKIQGIFGDDEPNPGQPAKDEPSFRERFRQRAREIFGFDEGREPGENFVEGIASGIGTALGKLWGKIAGWIWEGPDSLVGRIKRGLGIESPSTVMAEVGRNIIEGLIRGLGDRVQGLIDQAGQIPDRVIGAVGDASGWLLRAGRRAVDGLIRGLGEMFASLRTRAGQARTTVVNAVSNAGQWLLQTGRNTVSGLMSGISSWLGNLRTRAGNLRTTVINALSNAGNWLISTGKNVVIGLWNGLSSMGSWLWNKVVSFARNYVTRAVESALNIGSPSKVMAELGAYTAQGLAIGMESEAGQVEAAADRIAQAALPSIDSSFGLGLASDAAISRSLQVDQRGIELSWRTGATGDPLLDAIARLIDLRFRGNVQAALSRTGRSSAVAV